MPENYYADAYKSKKDKKGLAAWNEEIPKNVGRDEPQLHQPQNFNKALREGPRFYGKKGKDKG